MTERLIDAVCPHCGRVGTTVRVVLHEDGYTKLSRRCTDCGGECIHTFDHDWLSVARNKKLQADNERLTNAVALVSERVRQLSEERDYAWGEVEKLRAEIERLRNEDTKTRHALKGWVFVCPDGGDEPTHERVAAVVAEVDRLRADLATQQGCCDGAAAQDAHVRREREEHRAEVERLREALKPFAALFLWPDDAGDEWTVNDIRSDEDWSDLKNDATLDDKWVYRGDIRAARNALEGKI